MHDSAAFQNENDFLIGMVMERSFASRNPSGELSNGSVTPGILTTAGNLLFTGDPSGKLICFDPTSGKILWHSKLASGVSKEPMTTYSLDRRQYLVVGAGDMLYAFTLPGPE
jgi:glucose dehydrogenase